MIGRGCTSRSALPSTRLSLFRLPRMTIAVEERKHNQYAMQAPGEVKADWAPVHGIGVWVAALFLLGAMAGAGIMAMPNAFLMAGWWAVPMVTIMSTIGCLTGFQLSWCWTILQKNWPEHSQHTRNPYPEIAYRAGGKFFKYIVQGCVDLSMFGAAIAFLVLSSTNISHLMYDWFNVSIDFCYMVLIVGGCLMPILFLGTPKDFWPIAVGAIAATALFIIFIMVGTVIDMPCCRNNVTYPSINVEGFISAYCTISFAYGGHAAFPTIQHDMKQPAKFPISVIISFIALFVMYFPMPVLTYLVYGDTVQGTIDVNLSSKWIRDFIMVLITGHVLFAFFIVISPVEQDLERIVGIPLHFSWKRICTRMFMMLMIIFIALSLPDFNVLLELVGGTLLAATAYIFPGPFYLMLRAKVHKLQPAVKLVDKNSPKWKRQNSSSSNNGSAFFSHVSSGGGEIALWEYIVNFVVVSSGLIGAVAALYGIFVSKAKLSPPCYMNGMFLQPKNATEHITLCWEESRLNLFNDSVALSTWH